MKKGKLVSLLIAMGVLSGALFVSASTTQTVGNITAFAEGEQPGSQSDDLVPQTVTLDGTNAQADNGVLTLKSGNTVKDQLASGGTLVIPDSIDGNPVTEIGASVFGRPQNGAGIQKVVLPASVKKIDSLAFSNNQISSIDLSHVQEIGASAFSGNQLTNIDLSGLNSTAGDTSPLVNFMAFSDNKLTNIKLPTNISPSAIAPFAFSYQYWGNMEDPVSAKDVQVNYSDNLSWLAVYNAVKPSITSGSDQLLKPEDVMFDDTWGSQASPTDGVKSNSQTKQFDNLAALPEGGSFYRELKFGSYSLTNPSNNDSATGNYFILLNIKPVKSTVTPPTSGNTTQPEQPQQPETTPGPSTPQATNPGTGLQDKYPYAVYAKRAMRLHQNVNFTKPIKSFAKKSRVNAPSFKILGVAYSSNGTKRYKVKGGYITANPKYVTNLYYQSNTKHIKPIVRAVFGYHERHFTASKRIVKYKKGTRLNVRRIVKSGKITRYQLTNGLYVTANKQLVAWTK